MKRISPPVLLAVGLAAIGAGPMATRAQQLPPAPMPTAPPPFVAPAPAPAPPPGIVVVPPAASPAPAQPATSATATAAAAPPALTASPSASPSSSPAPVVETRPALAPATPLPPPPAGQFPELEKERARLVLENALEGERQRQKLAPLEAERQRLAAENALAREKLGAELAAKRAEIERAAVEIDVASKRTALLAEQRRAELEKELSAVRAESERTKANNEVASARAYLKQAELNVNKMTLDVERSSFDIAVAKRQSEISLRDRNEEWRSQVNHDIEYRQDPVRDGELVITDRRIPLSGVITMQTANYIADRINYYNNQSTEFPIFLVIDSSPGGSVMAGYKILKTMEGSPAPVYVVVKSFAASMAAGITTLAKHSFAYPNAIILHHQLVSGSFGNPVQQRENLREVDEWWHRLAEPVAKKMGVPLEEFVRQMYAHNSEGDWREFADKAVSLKWVDATVERIREASFTKNPDKTPPEPRPTLFPFRLETRPDAQGRPHEVLPRLEPFDCYYLYNPDGYFQMP